MRTKTLAAALVLAALPLAAPAQDADTVLATVNGTPITLGHVVSAYERLDPQQRQVPPEALLPALLDRLIATQALSDVAMQQLTYADQIALENQTRDLLAGRMLNRFAQSAITEEALRAAYDEMIADMPDGVEWNASHILVDTETEARAIKAQLDDGADFAALARSESTGPSGPNGGNLGWFGAGQMVPAFEEAVGGLETGGVSDPVQTQFGWHVVKLNDQREVQGPTFDEARAQLEERLAQGAVRAEIERIRAEADVTETGAEVDPATIADTDLLDR
ncbi:peptidylprolyl isomerase [Jannaschia sp. LMIT008]|uniref:peptidylprolyl isomerase n=1 Tax=Jannaschia maritima TaxID=3032585 RepID=UPI002810C95A|nr:peptidylprolyl isomerase [Jannaschia sp. LMIT008]